MITQLGGEDWVDVAYIEASDDGDDPNEGDEDLVEASIDSETESESSRTEDVEGLGSDGERQTLTGGRDPRIVDVADGFKVRVVASETGEAVVGAEVMFYDTLSPNYRAMRAKFGLYARDKEPILRRFGEHALTDEHGVAILPHGIPKREGVSQ